MKLMLNIQDIPRRCSISAQANLQTKKKVLNISTNDFGVKK